jgi:hypothetical protein
MAQHVSIERINSYWQYQLGDQIRKNEIGGGGVGWAYGTYGRQVTCIHGFGGKTLNKETTWKTLA